MQLNAARSLSVGGARFGRSALLDRVVQELSHEETEGQPPVPVQSLGIFSVCHASADGKAKGTETHGSVAGAQTRDSVERTLESAEGAREAHRRVCVCVCTYERRAYTDL